MTQPISPKAGRFGNSLRRSENPGSISKKKYVVFVSELRNKSKKDPQEKKGPGTEERTEPYSCTEFRLSAFHFDHSLLCMKNGSSLSSSFPIDCLRADPHTDIESV
ncbi:hypothetical protein VPH35_050287 [Triticum aestivum]